MPWTMSRIQTMTNKWCEYQKALKPVSLSKGFGSLMRFLLNQRVAKMNAIAMNMTIRIPVIPSAPLTRSQYVGLCFPKDELRYRWQSLSEELISLGKSHARWFPTCRITPTTIAAAIVCKCPSVVIKQIINQIFGYILKKKKET